LPLRGGRDRAPYESSLFLSESGVCSSTGPCTACHGTLARPPPPSSSSSFSRLPLLRSRSSCACGRPSPPRATTRSAKSAASCRRSSCCTTAGQRGGRGVCCAPQVHRNLCTPRVDRPCAPEPPCALNLSCQLAPLSSFTRRSALVFHKWIIAPGLVPGAGPP
jgi:hypothetical protein